MKKEKAYILGTDQEELFRLGVQHQIWAEEAHRGWRQANFRSGQTILDLGCGPGYCSKELAFLVGNEGKIISVDKSSNYIDFVKNVAQNYNLSIEAVHTDFDHMDLKESSLDGMYCRWALAWVPNPQDVLQKVVNALKPGGKMVLQEYYDWSLLQTVPRKEILDKAIAMALKSFKDTPNEIDIGRHLPSIVSKMGMKVVGFRPMAKIATPKNGIWPWPKTFFQSYFPRLVSQNYLSEKEASKALDELAQLEENENATICTCLMVEVIAEKIE